MADDHSSHSDSSEIEMLDQYGGQESVAAKTIDDDQVSNSIATKLAHLKSPSSSRHIFKVPEHIREGNEKAYEPYMLAIGPYHRGKPEEQEMEEHKKAYLKQLLDRRKEAVNRYVTAMRKLEEQARLCYADGSSDHIDTDEFVEMMLLDGCFIIELLRRFFMDDSFNFLSSIIKRLGRDLLLIENQIPFIVLEQLFSMTTTSGQRKEDLHQMVLIFFADSVLPDQSKVMGEYWAVCVEISTKKGKHQHLLSFIRDNWLRGENWRTSRLVKQNCRWFFYGRKRRPRRPNEKFRRFMRCATELKEAGIKFKRVHRSSLIDINFENGTMKIPQLEITGETESIFRNLIVYEQFSPSDDVKLVSHYIKFMDCLINSQKDVELLCKRNVLHNCLGDDEMVANMFNRLNDFVTLSPDNNYYDIFVRVNKYSAHSRHTWIANLRHKYFNSPWALISLFAAVLLLLFTLTQTVYSVLAYYK